MKDKKRLFETLIVLVAIVSWILIFFPKQRVIGGIGGFYGPGKSAYREDYACLGIKADIPPLAYGADGQPTHLCFGIITDRICSIETVQADSTIMREPTACQDLTVPPDISPASGVITVVVTIVPDPTESSLPVCWQCSADALRSLTEALDAPEHLLQPDAVKTGEEFDVNRYFEALRHLSMEPGYVLDYVYWFDELGGKPVLYARRTDEAPLRDFSEYLARRGEPTASYLEHTRVDGTHEGFYQFVLLHILGEQFYLWWHALTGEKAIVTDLDSLSAHLAKVGASCTEPTGPVREKASGLDLTPRVGFQDDLVKINVATFGSAGLQREVYLVHRSFPHTILTGETEMLIPYFCGVVP